MARVLLAGQSSEGATLEEVAGFFRDLGHEADVVYSGLDALSRIQGACPDVVVADVMLPGQDGFDLVKALQGPRTSGEATIILMTVISARVGTPLEIMLPWLLQIDGLIIKPYSDEGYERVVFQEQLIADIGFLLARQGKLAIV